MKLLLLSLLAVGVTAQAATISDKLRLFKGEPVKITTGKGVLNAKLVSVENDHFCLEMSPPVFKHERCYPIAAISYFSKPVEDRPFWIAVMEP